MKKLVMAMMLFGFSCITQAGLITDIAGNLLGATNVEVDGNLFDVAFEDGTCIDVFSGCDDNADFTFNTQSAAIAASWALVNQVFIGIFDTDTTRTNGCEDIHNFCWAYTPYDVNSVGQIEFHAATNGPEEYHDGVACCSTNDYIDLSLPYWDTATWAVWSVAGTDNNPDNEQGTTIPEPATLILFSMGLMVLVRRHSKSSFDCESSI
ncbi:PEP-CTERM sorting domain-containing protein [Lacimicrobium alkaliphilum]|uniref:Ice-binding protein C-terminal domain-containing protein n=1 Tax=Lacimicrobium alkaliphilum TaxID=1526571 RepID=A0ABQ1RBK9_9ALTE|nr:PEP-CTERM sorting domain-containing protein [Lacimicrobium alkaliphilum]GGD63017.1 hypothetical protein GCM10011357_17890 [Lacimicrobium alkaliphilum]